MQTNETINGMNCEQMIEYLKSKGAKSIIPKGVTEPLVRFVARDGQFRDVLGGACFIADFARINEALMGRA